MIVAGTQDRNREATEYLQTQLSLILELKLALIAISHNALPDLEESIADQEVLSARLYKLAGALSCSDEVNPLASRSGIDGNLKLQILVAADELQELNRSYASLLQHSSHSMALMASLVGSFEGQLQEASGPRSKYQTWSCQM